MTMTLREQVFLAPRPHPLLCYSWSRIVPGMYATTPLLQALLLWLFRLELFFTFSCAAATTTAATRKLGASLRTSMLVPTTVGVYVDYMTT